MISIRANATRTNSTDLAFVDLAMCCLRKYDALRVSKKVAERMRVRE
jgi:hypothetical protein